MAIFHYIGRDAQGKKISGTLEASSSNAVAEQLTKQRVIPITIKTAAVANNSSRDIDIGKYFVSKTVKPVDMIMFCRQMYALLKSGVPILNAIRGLIDTTKAVALKEVLQDVLIKLEKGFTLSTAMNHHPKVFNKLVISLVLVGESTGQLSVSFAKLAEYIEREETTKKNVKQAMRYPMFVVLFLIAAMFILNIFVIPVFTDLFASFKTELPLATRMLIASSDFFVNYWLYMIAAMILAFVLVNRYLATENGLYSWDKRKISLPIIGSIIERSLLARFSNSFAIVLKAGVPITTCLNLSAEAIGNTYMAESVIGMRRRVETGETLLRTATSSGLFTPLVLQMIAVGEETGQIDELLNEVGEYYEREVDYELKTLTDRIEPILIVIMAVLVLILALGIFTPMWDMFSVVQGG